MKTRFRAQSAVHALAGATLIAVAVSLFSDPVDAGFNFITFDPPDSNGTTSQAINNNGDVAGSYDAPSGAEIGFLRKADGTFQTFEVKKSIWTLAVGVNDKGQVTGDYEANAEFCFFRNAAGHASICGPLSQITSLGYAINVHGVLAGADGDENDVYHGFLWDKKNGAIVFDAPGAIDTIPYAINDNGLVTGSFLNTTWHGFIRDSGGTITTFDVAGASATNSLGINSSGVVAGGYSTNSSDHGFVRDAYGNITVFDVKGAAHTDPTGINKKGLVVGRYVDDKNHHHGFVRHPNGNIVTIDGPDSISTDAVAINNNGFITGSYIDTVGFQHGFIAVPTR